MYSDTQLFINGIWGPGAAGLSLPVENPATGEEIGRVAKAEIADLDRALEGAQRAFDVWRRMSVFDRYKIMRKAADIMRSRAEAIGSIMSCEQGKPVAEARGEAAASADIIEWFSEEARRAYGRIIPPRIHGVRQLVVQEPIGVVAAFTPWNFPINQAVRKISAALAAGCSIVVKGPEETPASCAELIRAFAEAGIPDGCVNLVYGVPAEISDYLIAHPVVRKVTFTGSTEVGKLLAAKAGKHMKRITMELGGHSPVIVFEDADVTRAADMLAATKFRNAGQVCVSPTRFLLQTGIAEEFTDRFVEQVKKIEVGAGEGFGMGPLANARRVAAVELLIEDAVSRGAKIATGGQRIGNKGNFFEPTVLTDVATQADIMNIEPFGPVAPLLQFDTYDDVISEANRLPYGLAAYAFTKSSRTISDLGRDIQSGMISINHYEASALGLPELPFGGIRDSGYGTEGGADALGSYLNAKLLTEGL